MKVEALHFLILILYFSVCIGSSSNRNGEVRLTLDKGSYYDYDSTSYRQGRLEVYYDLPVGYKWIPFSYDEFTVTDADRACRQLGYTGASNYGKVGDFGFYRGSGAYSILYYHDCPSSSTFYACSFSITPVISHYNDVAIVCAGPSTNVLALAVGLTVGLLFLCTCLCVATLVGVVIGGVIYHRKRRVRLVRAAMVPCQDSNELQGACGMTEIQENNSTTNVCRLSSSDTTAGVSDAAPRNVGTTLQPNTTGMSDTVAPQTNVGTALRTNTTTGVSGAVAPQTVGTVLQSNGRTETSIEVPGHDSGPSHNEDSDTASHSDDDQQPLLS